MPGNGELPIPNERNTMISALHNARQDPSVTQQPLAVDLDGTLVKTDLLLESILALVRRAPWSVLAFPLWLMKGKAFFKREISMRVSLDVSLLPYNQGLLEYLQSQHSQGRTLVLATAEEEGVARQVSEHLKIFQSVLASSGTVNLLGESKRDRLVRAFGERGFDYAGNSRRDLPVWSSARRAIVVNPSKGLQAAAMRVTKVEYVFGDKKRDVMTWVRALRLHQWFKNLLIFVPLAAAHRVDEVSLVLKACVGFTAFGLLASSVYILNDLLDLPDDRRHPRKRKRPFAAGDIPIISGLIMIPILLMLSCLLALPLPGAFLGVMGGYYLITLGYSLRLKRVVLLDVMVLAGLFTLRMMAGSAAVSIWPSSWLLAFSTFIFLSLAMVKRYAELGTAQVSGTEIATARAYRVSDKEVLSSMGVASGYASVLVLARYIGSDTARTLYSRQEMIWLLCPLLLYWISYLWLVAHRGGMHDDPLVFALKNNVSRITLLMMAAAAMIAI